MQEKSPYRLLMELAAAGMQLTATIAASAWIGWLLDKKFGTAPWLLIGLTLVGIVGGFAAFVRTLRVINGPK